MNKTVIVKKEIFNKLFGNSFKPLRQNKNLLNNRKEITQKEYIKEINNKDTFLIRISLNNYFNTYYYNIKTKTLYGNYSYRSELNASYKEAYTKENTNEEFLNQFLKLYFDYNNILYQMIIITNDYLRIYQDYKKHNKY